MTDAFVAFCFALLGGCQGALAGLGSQHVHAVTVALAKRKAEEIPGDLGRQVLDIRRNKAAQNRSIAVNKDG